MSLSFLVHKSFGHSLFFIKKWRKTLRPDYHRFNNQFYSELVATITVVTWNTGLCRPPTFRALSSAKLPCARMIPPLSMTTMSSQSGKYWVEWVTKSRVLSFNSPFFPRTWSKIARPTWASTALWSRVVRCGQICDTPKWRTSKNNLNFTLETKRIVKNVNISLGVHCSSYGNTLFLPSGQVDTLFTNFGLVTFIQNIQIRLLAVGIFCN